VTTLIAKRHSLLAVIPGATAGIVNQRVAYRQSVDLMLQQHEMAKSSIAKWKYAKDQLLRTPNYLSKTECEAAEKQMLDKVETAHSGREDIFILNHEFRSEVLAFLRSVFDPFVTVFEGDAQSLIETIEQAEEIMQNWTITPDPRVAELTQMLDELDVAG
jgi:hypothetical protein